MEKIIRDGREFFKFKIGDQFEAISGKGSFNKMKKEGLASDHYDEEKGFVYPFYDGSTINNHIKGHSKIFNYEGKAIKVAKDGAESGSSKLVTGKSYNADHSYYLVSDKFTNHYLSEYFNKKLRFYQQGTSIPSVKFSDYAGDNIEIPANHQQLSKVIARVLEYKQLSKQLSKQFKDYKQAILQEANKAIEIHKQNGDHDKYISFKIGDEFKAISGKGSFNKMKKEGLASDHYDEEKGFVYPVYDASQSNNHIKGYAKKYNVSTHSIKVSKTGNGIYRSKEGKSVFDPTPAGASKYAGSKSMFLDASLSMYSEKFMNEFIALFLNKFIPWHEQGTNGLHNVYFSSIKDKQISLPLSHNLLAHKIKQINSWETIVNQTTKQMETYIDGVLQMSLK